MSHVEGLLEVVAQREVEEGPPARGRPGRPDDGDGADREVTASKRPFLYFPLRHHFEQNMHVAHRLDRYGAGRRMDFDTATPATISSAIAEEIGRTVDYATVETDGARRAAEKLAELL